MNKKTKPQFARWRGPYVVLLECILLAGAAFSVLGADPNAGLPRKPEFTSNSQLESQFKSVPLKTLEDQALQGAPPAQAELARRYLVGVGVSSNATTALEWFGKAATNGFALAQANIGVLYENGVGVQKDLATAIGWYRRAADERLPFAAHRLGWLSQQKAAPQLDPKDALQLYELAAEQGDMEAAHRLAYLYWNPPWGGSIDSQTAVYWLSFAASKGYLPAFAGIGWYYMSSQVVDGRETATDYQEAERWFKTGAERNDPGCEYGLAMLELKLHESSPDLAEVRKWLLKSASKNYSDALYQLGQLSEFANIPHSVSMKPDYKEAANWYQRAAGLNHRQAAARLAQLGVAGKVDASGNIIDQLRHASDLGDMNARVDLAVRYQKGEARPRNGADSPLSLIDSAANSGNARAMVQLSDFYATGTFVTRDPIQSIHWLFCAARYSSEEAYERILRLKSGADQKPSTKEVRELQRAFDDYTAAVETSKPERAALLGRRYVDGTYGTNALQAAIWFSVAGMRQDQAAAAEARRIMAPFDEADRNRAKARADSIVTQSLFRLPGY